MKLTEAQKVERILKGIYLQATRDWMTAKEQHDDVLMARARMAIAAENWVASERAANATPVTKPVQGPVDPPFREGVDDVVDSIDRG